MKPQPSGGFEWVQTAGGLALVCRAMTPFADHLYTTREWALGSRAEADEDWEAVATSLGVDAAHMVRAHQVHGSAVLTVRLKPDATTDAAPTVRLKPDATTTTECASAAARPNADIILSNDPFVALAIQTADCVPLLVADRVTGAVAAAHAGWRGLAAGVPGVTIAALARECGSRPADLVAAAGPSVGACCYEVGSDVLDAFRRGGFDDATLRGWFLPAPRPTDRNLSMPGLRNSPRADRWFFDGWAATRQQLEQCGVPAAQIHSAELCTASHPGVLCSYRRDGKAGGRMAAAIRCAPPRP